MARFSLLFILLVSFLASESWGQNLSSTAGNITFYSKTAMEDISAKNLKVVGAINPSANTVAIRAMMKDFDFPNNLMEEHFNENYAESDKYPKATFSGKINEPIDWTKPGTYKVTATGKLEMHGVSSPKTITGQIVVSSDLSIKLIADFDIVLIDYNIKRPSIMMMKIAEKVDCKAELAFAAAKK
jgi:polyisoprenoid-binding protein YceI